MPRVGDWIETYTGKCYWPCDPRTEDVCLKDTAHSLANQCRFSGHSRKHYSVAEHSVRVSNLIQYLMQHSLELTAPQPEQIRIASLCGLHHDDAEAYVVDLPRPLKRYKPLGDVYFEIEEKNMAVICDYYGLPQVFPEIVKYADNVLLATEKRDLMCPISKPWEHLPAPLAEVIEPWSPTAAEQAYLARHSYLTR